VSEVESLPIDMYWRDGALHPANFFWARKATEQFAEGEVLSIVAREDRSAKSHRHYFAAIKQAWMNLPPLMAERFRNTEMLRKYALIQAGYCDSHSIACASPRDAQRTADFVRPIDEFRVVIRKGSVVTVFTAKSQSQRAMGKKDFAASKDAVLGIISQMIGVTANELIEAEAA
jgi:hypothetical protein